MAIPENLQKLTEKIETMLPVYQQKESKALASFVKNVEWNLKKLKDGSLDAPTWVNYTNSDFSNIALLLTKGEAGQAFASDFEKHLEPSVKPAAPAMVDYPGTAVKAVTPGAASPARATESGPGGPLFDVKGFLKEKVSTADEKLQWQTSVVDLFKLMGLESSIAGRKEVAVNLGMSPEEIASIGSEGGNELLRTRVVGALAQNSGKLPVAIA